MRVVIKIEATKAEIEERMNGYLEFNPPRSDLREHIEQQMVDEFMADKSDYIDPTEIEVVEV